MDTWIERRDKDLGGYIATCMENFEELVGLSCLA
jgi:hypothetical protein